MTDPDLLAKKLSLIETYVQQIRSLGRPEAIETDLREERFVEHTLQVAIQAALDSASHIVSSERLGEPNTNRELFTLLARGGWISPQLSDSLQKMAGFRNILVHGYQEVNPGIVRDIAENHLGDLLKFAGMIRRRLTNTETD